MKRMERILSLLLGSLLIAGPMVRPLSAQRETEVMVVEFVLDEVGVVTASAEIRNAGQTQHSMFVRLTDKPAQTCTDAGLNVQFEQGVSYQDAPDTVSWSLFGLPVTATEYGAVGTTYRQNTSGAVRNLRINATAFDTVRCLVSVTYVGSTRPVPLYDIGGDTNVVFATYYMFNPVAANPACNAGEYFLFYNVTDMELRLCANGVISDVGGGSAQDTKIVLNMTDAITLDETTNNTTAQLAREKATAAGIDAFWLEGAYNASGQQLMWTFVVPANYASSPILTMYGYGSTAVGTFDFGATLRCLTPDNGENWTTKAFDTINALTAQSFGGAGFLETLVIPLTNDDDMAAGDLCTIIFSQNSAAFTLSALSGVINYTGS